MFNSFHFMTIQFQENILRHPVYAKYRVIFFDRHKLIANNFLPN